MYYQRVIIIRPPARTAEPYSRVCYVYLFLYTGAGESIKKKKKKKTAKHTII